MFAFSLGLALMPFVSAVVHDVMVGNGGKLVYNPEAIAANPGDQVVFHFSPKNHTVTQSAFANPCGLKDGGFSSGFQPVAANQTDNLPTYTVQVNNTDPIWVFCAQAANTANSHCGAGMVFAINCGLDGAPNSFTNFKNSALAIGASLKANAPSSTAAAQAYTTAAYGGYTIPVAPTPVPVTIPVTLGTETWTTTYASYPNSPAPTPASAEGQVHKVIVGGPNGKLTFDPSRVSALPRDTIVFEFHEKNHTITQSAFDDPCRPLKANGTASAGFDSGFQPSDGTTLPTWNFTVKDTAPVWAYCRQGNHCGAGMVFAINSDESSPRSFQAFQDVAKGLNGTAAAASAPPAAATQPSSAASIKIGGAGMTFLAAAAVAVLL